MRLFMKTPGMLVRGGRNVLRHPTTASDASSRNDANLSPWRHLQQVSTVGQGPVAGLTDDYLTKMTEPKLRAPMVCASKSYSKKYRTVRRYFTGTDVSPTALVMPRLLCA